MLTNKTSNPSGTSAEYNKNSNYCPDIDRKHKLQTCFPINIHTIIEAAFYSQIKVNPGKEDYKNFCEGVCYGWEKGRFIYSNNVGIENKTIECSN